MVFYSSRSHPPRNSIAALAFRFWVSSKTRGGSSQRSCAVCFLIYVYPIDIARLKSGIRRTPPPLFETPKTRGGGYFTWSGEIFLRNFLPYPPPTNIPGWGSLRNVYQDLLVLVDDGGSFACWNSRPMFCISHTRTLWSETWVLLSTGTPCIA